jgi:hypothetical protein
VRNPVAAASPSGGGGHRDAGHRNAGHRNAYLQFFTKN